MDLIQKNFGLEAPSGSEAQLERWLEERISWMLDHETDLLFSTLYRLDVDEIKIKNVLHHAPAMPIAAGLAKLVLERQRDRHATKQNYPVDRSHFHWGDEE